MGIHECDFREFPNVLMRTAIKRELLDKLFLKEVGKAVKNKAKELIGHEQPEWPPLADVTKADRVSKGYPENEPLLREGRLRNSVGYKVNCGIVKKDVAIGYKVGYGADEYAKAQEEGKGKITSRPALKTALFREHSKIISSMVILGNIFTQPLIKSVSDIEE
jgi:hypothetical protein